MESITLEELEKKAKIKEQNYSENDGYYKCKTCSSDILSVVVIFSIHDGPFPMSGSGKTITQEFPYCPKCETRPEFRGSPIKP